VTGAYVAGVGISRFGKRLPGSIWTLGRTAIIDAMADADIHPRQVGMLICATARSGSLIGRENGIGHLLAGDCGIRQVPIFDVKAHCASGAVAFNIASTYIAAGQCDVAVAVGLERMSNRKGKGHLLTADGMEAEGDQGFTPAAYFAMMAQQHMLTYGTTREQLAQVAVKNRLAGSLNDKAQYRQPVHLGEVLASPVVADPLGLYDCCPTGDGAAAAVLVSSRAAGRARPGGPVLVAASVLATGSYAPMPDMTAVSADSRAAAQAYQQAGLGPADIEVAEVHDAFTISELVHYEDLGFCAKGEAGALVQAGVSGLGGRLPVNPSGGLLSRGHPLGATGIAQITEIVQQLRGACGARQAGHPRVGLTQVSGGFAANEVATSGVTVLVR
jgi:acetyl-CoA acetyltransferase